MKMSAEGGRIIIKKIRSQKTVTLFLNPSAKLTPQSFIFHPSSFIKKAPLKALRPLSEAFLILPNYPLLR